MSKPLYIKVARLLAVLLLVAESPSIIGASGDTTWVTVFNAKWLDHYGNYDTTALFPTGKRYRKIRMHYILGRYACPGNPQYCGSWDYTTQIFARPKAKDTVEVAKVITPYATDWLQKNKSHDYIVDVTDYASVLDDSTGIRFKYDGYSWGFTITLKFELIEGTPIRDAMSVKNIYRGYFAYGNASNPIESHLPPTVLSYSTPYAAVKNSISGHGSDPGGCSEFCDKYYELLVNGSQAAQKQIWRNDCGVNPVSPQTGTWVFDRGNWCPGAVVWPIYHPLDGITTPLTTFTADINMQPYTSSNPSGGYGFETQLVSYGNFNAAQDISIEEIISPTSDPNFSRQNPVCRNPVIKFKNCGSNPIVTFDLEYGMTGHVLSNYTFSGMLNPLETMELTLPPTTAVLAHSASVQFEARVVSVGGTTGDDNLDNNVYTSKTTTVPIYPEDLVVRFATNGSVINGVSETSWKIYDENDQVVAQRINANVNSLYNDTIKDLPTGCYKFVIQDAGCDGFSWWFYPNYPTNPGNGYLRFNKADVSAALIVFPGDIGCGSTTYFHVGNYPAAPGFVGIGETDLKDLIQVYPNPAAGWALLKLNLEKPLNVSYAITDVTGKRMSARNLGAVDILYERLDLSILSPGIYFVSVTAQGQAPVVKKLILE